MNKCGGCTRFKREGDRQRYMCACHHREDAEVTADAEACGIYIDYAERQRERERQEREREERCKRLHEETRNLAPVKLKFLPAYDSHTDSVIQNGELECPYCGEMPYSTTECRFCGIRFIQDDDVAAYNDLCSGKKTEVVDCISCGQHTMIVKHYKYNGEWRTAGGTCSACGVRFIV